MVYLTAYADEETILRAKKTTPFGYLVKPFNERELRATIEIAFYTHQMERTLADERAKRQAAEEFRILVEGVSDYAIFMLDRLGHVTTWNSGAERLKGYTRGRNHRQGLLGVYTEEERQAGRPQQLLEVAFRVGRYEEEGWRVRKDGSRFWASVVLTALHDESGRLRGFAKSRATSPSRSTPSSAWRFWPMPLGSWENRSIRIRSCSSSVAWPSPTLRTAWRSI